MSFITNVRDAKELGTCMDGSPALGGDSKCATCGKEMPGCWDTVCAGCGDTSCYEHSAEKNGFWWCPKCRDAAVPSESAARLRGLLVAEPEPEEKEPESTPRGWWEFWKS